MGNVRPGHGVQVDRSSSLVITRGSSRVLQLPLLVDNSVDVVQVVNDDDDQGVLYGERDETKVEF